MDEKLKEQFEQFVEECGENYNNVDKVKKPCIALTFLTFWKLSLRHCPHAVKREKKEEKSRQINLCVLFTVAFTSTQYSTVYLNMIPLSKDAWMFFCRRIPLFCKLLVAISSIAQCLCVDIYRSSTKQPIFLLHLCPNMYHTIDSIPKHVTLQQRSQQRQSKSHQSEACLLSVCMWGDCSKTLF